MHLSAETVQLKAAKQRAPKPAPRRNRFFASSAIIIYPTEKTVLKADYIGFCIAHGRCAPRRRLWHTLFGGGCDVTSADFIKVTGVVWHKTDILKLIVFLVKPIKKSRRWYIP